MIELNAKDISRLDRLARRRKTVIKQFEDARVEYDVHLNNIEEHARKILEGRSPTAAALRDMMDYAVKVGLRDMAIEWGVLGQLNDREIGEIVGLSTSRVWQLRARRFYWDRAEGVYKLQPRHSTILEAA